MPWDVDDETLLDRVRSGDERAMRRLYDRYVGFLRGTCRRYLTDEDEVKDVLQESFIKIFGALDRFSYRGPGSLRAWMKQIVVHQALNALRARKWTCPLEEETSPEPAEEEPEEVDQVPLEVIQGMIDRLPEGYRVVFSLYALDGLSHRQVAEALGITEGTSASQYARARRRLAEMIKEYTSHER